MDFKPVGDDARFLEMQRGSQGLLQNISGGGVCVRMDSDQAAGQLLALTIQLPGFPTSVIALGKVQWSKPVDGGFDCGIEFWWVGWEDQSAQEQIRNFISTTLNEDEGPED